MTKLQFPTQPQKQKNETLQVRILHTLQEYLSHPLQLNEMETIIQKADSLVKLEEVRLSSILGKF